MQRRRSAPGSATRSDGRTVRRRQAQRPESRWASYLLVPRPSSLLAIVIVYPVVSAIVMSFQKDAGLDPATGLFVAGRLRRASRTTRTGCSSSARPGGGTIACPPGTLGVAVLDRHRASPFFFTVVTVALETVLGFWFAHDHEPHLPRPRPGPRRHPGAVGHPHRRDRQAVVLHLRLRRHRQQAASHPHPVDRQRVAGPIARSSSPTSGRPRRSWRC